MLVPSALAKITPARLAICCGVEGARTQLSKTRCSPAVNSISSNLRARIVELANRKRVPVILSRPPMLEVGGLFAYNSSLSDQIRRSAHLVDKILKGAQPAEIPVEQATRFELAINVKAAKALGITVPKSMLLRADEVIQ